MGRLSKMLIYNGLALNTWDPYGKERFTAPVVSPLDLANGLCAMGPEHQGTVIHNIISPCVFIDATGIDITTDSDKMAPESRLKQTTIAPPFNHTWIDLPEMVTPDKNGAALRKSAFLMVMQDAKGTDGLRYVYCGLFVELGTKVRGPLVGMDFMVAHTGQIVGDVQWMHADRQGCWGGVQQIALTNNLLHAAVSVMLFMNCKGIKLYRDSVSSKVQKKAKYRLGQKILSYTLNIDKPGITYESVNAYGEKRKLRYHTVRGHIRIYTAEKPHVSGWVGPMYISPHVRGDRGNGEIRKDYKLTPKGPGGALSVREPVLV